MCVDGMMCLHTTNFHEDNNVFAETFTREKYVVSLLANIVNK